jgi:hypothetical protein
MIFVSLQQTHEVMGSNKGFIKLLGEARIKRLMEKIILFCKNFINFFKIIKSYFLNF